jgi:CheY-like chemotaxis protein
MWLESDREVGTCFQFSLPIAPAVAHAARPGHQIREDWAWRESAFRSERSDSAEELGKRRIVVCDESGALYDPLSRYSDQVEVVDGGRPDQLPDVLRECPAHAILVNADSPVDVWPALRSAARQVRDTPLIGCAVPRTVGRAEQAGALGHLVKPVTRADLANALATVGRPVRKVLVVDDDADVLSLFSRMLRAVDQSLEIATTSSGSEAIELLRSGTVDLLLLDVVMPDLGGWELFDHMVADDELCDVPTFFVSAQDPTDQVPASELLVATTANALSPSTLLRCSLALSRELLGAGAGSGPVPL